MEKNLLKKGTLTFLNQITVIYGMFPKFYKDGRPDPIITEDAPRNGSYKDQQRVVKEFDESYLQTFIQTNDIGTG